MRRWFRKHSAALTTSGWGPWRFPRLWSPWKWLGTEGRRSGGPTGLSPGDGAASLAAGRVGLRPACGPAPSAWGPTESPPAGETLHVATQACRGRGDGTGRRAWATRPPPELGGGVGSWKRTGSSLSPRARVGRHRRAPRCVSGPGRVPGAGGAAPCSRAGGTRRSRPHAGSPGPGHTFPGEVEALGSGVSPRSQWPHPKGSRGCLRAPEGRGEAAAYSRHPILSALAGCCVTADDE